MSFTSRKPEISEAIPAQWQAIVNVLAKVCRVPACLIMRVHSTEIEAFVCSESADNPYEPGERASLSTGLYCEEVMANRGQLLVPNAHEDPVWEHNPDIELGMISYLGYPLLWPDGEVFGTICILDRKTNPYSPDVMELMTRFRETVETSLAFLWEAERRRAAELELQEANAQLEIKIEERTAELAGANIRLRQEMIIRRTAEDQIRSALEEKVVLLREIHHRVRNNLAVVSSILSLQAGYVDDEAKREMLRDTKARIGSMALAHDFLFQSESLAELNLMQYFHSLLDHLLMTQGSIGTPVTLKKEIEELSVGLDTAVLMGFLLTELVSNCLKHAFPKGGEGTITISFRSVGEREYQLIVADNGVGIQEDIDLKAPKTLGLDLVDTFVQQLKGWMEVWREGGTGVRIVFKEQRAQAK
ncbi:sensor histidine kinase [Thermodesulfobacteriota bacterium]